MQKRLEPVYKYAINVLSHDVAQISIDNNIMGRIKPVNCIAPDKAGFFFFFFFSLFYFVLVFNRQALIFLLFLHKIYVMGTH